MLYYIIVHYVILYDLTSFMLVCTVMWCNTTSVHGCLIICAKTHYATSYPFAIDVNYIMHTGISSNEKKLYSAHRACSHKSQVIFWVSRQIIDNPLRLNWSHWDCVPSHWDGFFAQDPITLHLTMPQSQPCLLCWNEMAMKLLPSPGPSSKPFFRFVLPLERLFCLVREYLQDKHLVPSLTDPLESAKKTLLCYVHSKSAAQIVWHPTQ